ncbi:MAG: protein kinase [Deltaproteobacteria bacterium]|nr:protein kinase [Deltaproteobacteria bacterium]
MHFADHTGEVLEGRYRLLKKIAEGGMGSIYLGQHMAIGREVAVKLLRTEFVGSEVIVTRFYREAEAAARIKHDNIIDIFDLGVSPWGEPYLVMEYLEGESLAAVLDRIGPVDLDAACGIMAQILRALQAAHEAGIVHRDLKPENIFLVHGRDGARTVKLIDFGISKFSREGEKAKLTRTGSVLGTLEYMSPEQARGRADVSHLTDIYAAGVVFYQMLTGTFPFTGGNYSELFINTLTMPPLPPGEAYAGFPAEAEPIVMRALAKDPADRFESAAQMLDALSRLEAFGTGEEKLKDITDSVDTLCFATGDLGEHAVTDVDGIATKVLGQMGLDRTPGEWTGGAPGPAVKGMPRRTLVLVLAGVAAAGIAVVAAVLLSGSGAPSGSMREIPVAAHARAPVKAFKQTSPNAGVLVTVQGAPESARVYYQDALVPMNPFRAERKSTIVPLRVEAEGYEPFAVAVLPTADQVVTVDMARKKPRLRAAGTAPAKAGVSDGRAVVARRKAELKACYDQALKAGAAPSDKDLSVGFRVQLAASGAVKDVALSGSGAGIESMRRCLDASVRSWVFPPGSDATPLEFSFVFTTKGEP